MNKEKLIQARNLLGHDNFSLGKELGFTCTKYQCKQLDNLINGSTDTIKPILFLALECLAQRDSKLKEFKKIMEE